MKLIETYKGINIYMDKNDSYVTAQPVPVIGTLQVGHKTIEAAKAYIDSITK